MMAGHHQTIRNIYPVLVSGVGWDSGSVPKDLVPGGTPATFSEGHLLIDTQASSVNVTALVGKQAVLSCFIRNINNHSVRLKHLSFF